MRATILLLFFLFQFLLNEAKAQTNNRISLQTGLIHCFFDGSPILNTNYLTKNQKPLGGLLISSYGLNYQRNVTRNSFVAIDLMTFNESYRKYLVEQNYLNVISERRHFTSGINYGRILPLGEKFELNFGGGIDFRIGSESYIVGRTSTELNIVSSSLKDFGLNCFGGLNYTPLKWLSLYSRIDFLGFIWQSKNSFKSYNVTPTRFDTSLRFGIGINF